MDVDLRFAQIPAVRLPDGYRFVSWHSLLLERHARIKWRSFRNDLDGRVFPCLSDLQGCRRLMKEITRQPRFCALATWMIVFQPEPDWPAVDCGTIQGIERAGRIGSIQNIGVVPEHRSFGLGRALLLKSLHGFAHAGLVRASLEVTASNRPAVNLYRSVGFDVTRVLYRNADGGSIVSGSERPPETDESSRSQVKIPH
jgi:ribosomal protein S18 acetylase RimI-like enzyme